MNISTRLFAVALFASFLVSAQEAKPAPSLQALSLAASSVEEHQDVAKRARTQAAELNAKADRHEKRVAELMAQPAPPIAHKWPAMQPKPWEKERKLAVQARRGAVEAAQLAARHEELATRTAAKSADVD
jgi:hypothetical protein